MNAASDLPSQLPQPTRPPPNPPPDRCSRSVPGCPVPDRPASPSAGADLTLRFLRFLHHEEELMLGRTELGETELGSSESDGKNWTPGT